MGKPIRLVFLGPPGSGKGTQAKLLAENHGLVHVSTGDLLRQNITEQTDLGKQAEAVIAQGGLVRTRLIFEMLLELYEEERQYVDRFILDGFPRSLKQAEGLSNFLDKRGKSLTHVLQLNLDDEAIVERLVHRRTCTQCGRSYHLLARPPASPGVCDDDGTELSWRDDDTEDVIRHRLKTYHEETAPVVDFYQNKGLVVEIDGSKELEEIQSEISSVLGLSAVSK